MVKGDNERLSKRLYELKLKRTDLEKKEKEITEPPKRELKKDHRLIPGEIAFHANNVEPDQLPHSVASDLGLHCLPMS